jgi:L,D-peptidoglycan transpeptidase YkuD (ErfK/YbiS/YcfS/YnhG family)
MFGFVSFCAADTLEELNELSEDVRQAVVVQAEEGIKARVSAWERGGATGWHQTSGPMDAVIGRNGLASEGMKREGDGRTPAGIFNLRRAFGYGNHGDTGLSYKPVGARDFWIDDPRCSI